MSLLTFIIPVRHQDNARDWGRLKSNLVQTAASIANQSQDDWRAIVVANEGADLPQLPERFAVERVDFPANSLHEQGDASREDFHEAFRIDKGRRVLRGMLRARESRYFMIVDDDDFVSRRIVRFVSEDVGAYGWKIDHGYVWDDGGRLLFESDAFNHLCGTSLIVRADLYGAPQRFEDAPPDWIKSMLGSHVKIAGILAERGTPLTPLPFRGAVYRVGHPGSHSRAPSLVRKYIWNRDSIRRPGEALRNVAKVRFVSESIRREFFGLALPRTDAGQALVDMRVR